MKMLTRPARNLAEIPPELRRRLEDERERLLALLRSDADVLATPAEDRGEDLTASQHPADVAGDLIAREGLLGRERSYRRDLAQVDAALERMRCGDYGWCAECGRPIPIECLDVLPQASRCVSCELRAPLRSR